MWHLAAFAAALAFFHASEYGLAYLYMRHELSLRSLLITKPYLLAMTAGVVEYLMEQWACPWVKQMDGIALVGATLLAVGEAVRKAAMVTARQSFTHDIQRYKRPEHRLVTHGIYRYVRHPGYLGWLLWAVGTQLLLINPLCSVVFAVVAWRFFSYRIPYEEDTLLHFFGEEYEQYAARTPTWIPGIP